MNILQVNASARREGAQSTRIAQAIVARLNGQSGPARLNGLRHFASHSGSGRRTKPHSAPWFTPAEQRTPAQAARVALDDALIAEVQAADVLVLGAPMYNFGVSVQLKTWIDAIARAGVTFRYTGTGRKVCSGKKSTWRWRAVVAIGTPQPIRRRRI